MKKICMFGAALILALVLSNCGGGATSGPLAVTTWGEAFIEQGIPASEFADGWAVTFSVFLINLGEIKAARAGAAPGLLEGAYKIWDLTKTGPFTIATATVPGGLYNDVSYRLKPADNLSTAGNASLADMTLMQTNGYAVYVSGTATKGVATKQFAWGFAVDTHYRECQGTALVTQAGDAKTQLTIHGDHFFYDDLAASDPSLRFQTLADADTNGDNNGIITLQELAAVSGTAFSSLDNYGVGNQAQITDLKAYLEYLVRTLGHIDGEGHCHTH